MIFALPRLLEIFPKARVIYLTRNGLANAVSATKYFNVSFETACRNWSRCGEAWDRVIAGVSKDKVLWIEHEQLVESPTEVAGRLADHLTFSKETKKLLLRFMVTSACEWQSNTKAGATLENAKLTNAQRTMFLDICGSQMVRQEYYSEPELESLRNLYRRADIDKIALETAKVLQSEDSTFVEARDGRLYMVPGKLSATIVMYDQLDVAEKCQLTMTIGVSSPYAQGVRIELLGINCNNGELVVAGQFELAALKGQEVALSIKQGVKKLDLLIRVLQGCEAKSNDNSWCFVENLQIRHSGEAV